MDNQEKYYELDNIISTLSILLDDVQDEKYKELLRDIKWQAEDELEIYEEILQKEYDQEQYEMEKNYRKEQGF